MSFSPKESLIITSCGVYSNEKRCSRASPLRMEVPVQVGKEPYYVGIAEFGIEQLTTAIEMISDSPAMYTIICANHDRPSHCQELLDQVLDIGLTESGGLPVVEMVTTLTAQGYAICTWGSSSEEQELQCFYTAAFL